MLMIISISPALCVQALLRLLMLDCGLAVLMVPQAVAQTPAATDSVQLQLVDGTRPLPAQTALVILTQGGLESVMLDSTGQELLQAGLFARHDTLGGQGLTQRAYARTNVSNRVYFLYALTPEGTLYSSYSVTEGAPLFETLNTGRIKVAPVEDSTLAARIIEAFLSEESDTGLAPDPLVLTLPDELLKPDPLLWWMLAGFLVLALAPLYYFLHRFIAMTARQATEEEEPLDLLTAGDLDALQNDIDELNQTVQTLKAWTDEWGNYLAEAIPLLSERMSELESSDTTSFSEKE